MDAYVWWLLIGAVMMAVEVFAMPTFVLFFAGIAAVCVGVMTGTGLLQDDSYLMQWAWFFGLTVMWAAVLWKPVKKFRTITPHGQDYKNITGDIATVVRGSLKKGVVGQVQWSGTLMNARLSDNAAENELPEGTIVEITDVKGNTVTVKLKQ